MNVKQKKTTDRINSYLFVSILTLLSFVATLSSIYFFVPFDIMVAHMGLKDIPVLFGSVYFGPYWGMLIGGLSDILFFHTHPIRIQMYLPQLTILAMLRGFLPGFLTPYVDGRKTMKRFLLQIGLSQFLCSALFLPLLLFQAVGIPLLDTFLFMLISFALTMSLSVFIWMIIQRMEALKEEASQNTLLQLLQESSIDGSLVIGCDGNVLFFNQRFVELWEVPEPKMPLDSFQGIIDLILSKVSDSHSFLQWIHGLSMDQREESPLTIILKDGRVLEGRTAPLFLEESDYYGRAYYYRDITEQNEVEAEREAIQERLDLALSVANDGIWDWHIAKGSVYFDDRYYTMAGYEPQEFPSCFEEWERHVHPQDLPRCKEALQAHLVGEVSHYDVDVRWLKKDGSWMWIQGIGKIVERDEGGRATRLVGTHTDITSRKEAEEIAQERFLELEKKSKEMEELYRQLSSEIHRAQEVHRNNFPKNLPEVEGISLFAYYQPAERIGGDFYDVIHVNNKLIFYLSDVSGHGLDSSMLSFFVKHTIHGFLSFSPLSHLTPATILRYLAEQFQKESYPKEYFIGAFVGVLDLETKELTFSGAGFQDPLLIRGANGQQWELYSRGLFITSFLSIDLLNFQEESIALPHGATLLIHTDGLAEQENAGAIYKERLTHLFFHNGELPPHLISQRLLEDFRDFNNGWEQGLDDITFLIIQLESEQAELHLELRSDFSELVRMREELFTILEDMAGSSLLVSCVNELVVNAMEHGNHLDPKKRVSVRVALMKEFIQVIVEDEGEGFNWRSAMDRPLDLADCSKRGRGIAMTKKLCDDLTFNERGNKATLFKMTHVKKSGSMDTIE